MARIPTWPELWHYTSEVIEANATIWQTFIANAAAGTATASEYFQDVVMSGQSWMALYGVIIGAGGSPQPPVAFVYGTPWPNTAPTKSATARLELPLDPATNTLLFTGVLSLVGGGSNPYPLQVSVSYVDPAGALIQVDVSRSATSGEDPASGTHVGTVYTAGDLVVASIVVVVP